MAHLLVDDTNSDRLPVSSAGSSLGTGGMSTKLTAARLATSAGVTTVITRSSTPSNIFHIVSYIQSRRDSTTSSALSRTASAKALASSATAEDCVASLSLAPAAPVSQTPFQRTSPSDVRPCLPSPPLHTRFLPKVRAIRDRYFWILHGLKPHGTLIIDDGAYRALTRTDKAGLLPVGIIDVQGLFAQQECVSLVVAKRMPGREPPYERLGPELGRALVNYTSVEISRIRGLKSSQIETCLGYAGGSPSLLYGSFN
jgi:glutamate 5-kinase